MYKQQGVRGCFRGLGATILREIPGFSVYITSYQYYCDCLTEGSQTDPSFRVSLIAGGFAGVTSWIINIPVDVVKSRLQSDSLTKPKYSGFKDCAVKLWQHEGMRVFWRGLPVTCLRAFPLNAITLGVYSSTLQFMQKRAKEMQEL